MSYPTPSSHNGNPLVDIVPVSQRKRIYSLFGLVGVIIGAIGVAMLAATGAFPLWLTVTVLVFNFLSPFFAGLAASNAKEITQS